MITVIIGVGTSTHDAVESASYTTNQLAEFTGVYYSSEIDATYNIVLKANKLALSRKNVDGETSMLGQFADAFSVVGTGSIRFTRSSQNQVTGFWLNTGRVRRLGFEKRDDYWRTFVQSSDFVIC